MSIHVPQRGVDERHHGHREGQRASRLLLQDGLDRLERTTKHRRDNSAPQVTNSVLPLLHRHHSREVRHRRERRRSACVVRHEVELARAVFDVLENGVGERWGGWVRAACVWREGGREGGREGAERKRLDAHRAQRMLAAQALFFLDRSRRTAAQHLRACMRAAFPRRTFIV